MKLYNPFNQQPDISLLVSVVLLAVAFLGFIVSICVLYPPIGISIVLSIATGRVLFSILTGK